MSAPGPIRRRLGRIAFVTTIALGGAIAACNSIAELDLKYSPTALQVPDGALLPDGGEVGPSDGGRRVRDSSFEASSPSAPLEFDAAPLGQCEGGIADPESLCDHTAGYGCCVRSTAASSECMHQLDFATHCLAKPASAVFVACIKSNDDNECCWRNDKTTNRNFAVYSKSCAAINAPMVCAEDANCPLGQVCNFPQTPCHEDIKIGLCGQAGGAAPACP